MSAIDDAIGAAVEAALSARLDRIEATLDALASVPRTYSRHEAADVLGVGAHVVDDLLERGVLWKLDLGTRSVRISRRAIEQFLDTPPAGPNLEAVA